MAKAQPSTSKAESTEVELAPSQFSREELQGIESFDDAVRLALSTNGTVVNAHQTPELGDGFRVADEAAKRRLIGVPLLLLEWTFRPGDYADDYVSVRAISQDENGNTRKWIINDGSTGIARDLRDFQTKTGRTGGLMVRNGLRVSDYHIDAETREPITRNEYREYQASGKKAAPAATFYLDTSA